jgi:peptidoglycan lytic transglycosylase
MAREAALSILLFIVSACAWSNASAAQSRQPSDTYAQEKGHKAKGAKAKAAQAKRTRTGLASYYGPGFHGRKTASGKTFDKTEMVAAHPSYPLGTRVKVTNLGNGRAQELRIIDRGPTPENRYEGVIIDVSEGAATRLGFHKKGRTLVKVEVLEWAEKEG